MGREGVREGMNIEWHIYIYIYINIYIYIYISVFKKGGSFAPFFVIFGAEGGENFDRFFGNFD